MSEESAQHDREVMNAFKRKREERGWDDDE